MPRVDRALKAGGPQDARATQDDNRNEDALESCPSMANILYGVNGEGSGHSSRAREVITYLQGRGHRVHVASFHRGLRNLKNDFDVTEIDGLRLTYVHNRVRYGKTVLGNLVHVPQVARSVRALEHKAAGWDLDLVITDFEPICCYVGHKLHLPIIAIDNQHLLTDTQISYPREYRKEAVATKLVTRLMTPRADAYLVISFFPARVQKKNTFLFPPILREEVLRATPTSGNREGKDGNLEFRKPGLDTFLGDLSTCRAVIANAGFSLISEALYLEKPYLAWPVKGQFEQIFNAYYIGKTGYGAYWDDLNKERVESFLYNLDVYRANLATYQRQDNSALFAKLETLIASNTK